MKVFINNCLVSKNNWDIEGVEFLSLFFNIIDKAVKLQLRILQ
jgi:hypothetical protein